MQEYLSLHLKVIVPSVTPVKWTWFMLLCFSPPVPISAFGKRTCNASVVQHSVVLVTKCMESALEVPSRKHLSQSCNSSRGTHPLLSTKDARTAAYSCRTNKSQIYFFACRGSKFFITSTSNKKLSCSVIKYNIHWLNLYWIANVDNEKGNETK